MHVHASDRRLSKVNSLKLFVKDNYKEMYLKYLKVSYQGFYGNYYPKNTYLNDERLILKL